MDQSILTRKASSNTSLLMKAPRVHDDAMQLEGAIERLLDCDNKHWPNPVTRSVLFCQLCRWSSVEKVVSKIKLTFFLMSTFLLDTLHFFCMNKTQVEDKQTIASSRENMLEQGGGGERTTRTVI